MGLHKPIISTNVGGIPEMIDDGKDGIFLVNFDEMKFLKHEKVSYRTRISKKITEGNLNLPMKNLMKIEFTNR